MAAQWWTIVKISLNHLTQGYRASHCIQIHEQLLKSMNVCVRIGVDYVFLDVVGNELHDFISQNERRAIFTEGSLSFIALNKRFMGPFGIMRNR